MKSSFVFLTLVRFTNQSFSESLYPNGKSRTLLNPFSLKFRTSSTASGENPSMGVESTSSKAAAIIAAPKPIYACFGA